MSGRSVKHETHGDNVKRLKRSDGHLRGVVKMIDDHLDYCLEEAVGPLSKAERRSIDQFKEITHYL